MKKVSGIDLEHSVFVRFLERCLPLMAAAAALVTVACILVGRYIEAALAAGGMIALFIARHHYYETHKRLQALNRALAQSMNRKK